MHYVLQLTRCCWFMSSIHDLLSLQKFSRLFHEMNLGNTSKHLGDSLHLQVVKAMHWFVKKIE